MALKKSIQKSLVALGVARIGIGLVFLWAFVDKLFGLGFATCRSAKTGVVQLYCDKAWVHGGSPTLGFLKFATKGPMAHVYQNLVGHTWVDWLFMMGLLFIGAALVSGIGVKIATWTGSLLLLMMWSAALWPANNPILDEHLIYIAVLMAVGLSNDEQKLGLGVWWRSQPLVQKLPFLQ